jgi:ABC-type Fe3+ transport system substrate-binding protein
MTQTSPTTPEPSKPPAADRAANGHFAAGNAIGKLGGRPQREVETAYLRTFYQALTPSEMTDITRAIIRKAKGGNIAAAKLLMDHAIGRPVQRIEASVAQEEYRVAGLPPDQHKQEMMQRFLDSVENFRRAKEDDSSKAPRRKSPKKKPSAKPRKSAQNNK